MDAAAHPPEGERPIDAKDLALTIAELLDAKKAEDIRIIDVGERLKVADYFLVCTGQSRAHVRALYDEIHARVLAQPGVALVDAQLADDVDPERAAILVRGWRDELRPLSGRAELRNAGPDLLERVAPWDGEPRGLEAMRRLRRALDPAGVFASGRLAGGL